MSTDFDQLPDDPTSDPNYITQDELQDYGAYERPSHPMRVKLIQKVINGGNVQGGEYGINWPLQPGQPLVYRKPSPHARDREVLSTCSALRHALDESEDAELRAQSVEHFRTARQKLAAEAWGWDRGNILPCFLTLFPIDIRR